MHILQLFSILISINIYGNQFNKAAKMFNCKRTFKEEPTRHKCGTWADHFSLGCRCLNYHDLCVVTKWFVSK
uniref:Uncharacterized protein n=1 Tax=Arundo donax TaxID=35708 RepID=A0A0A9GUM7_ARUDO